MSIFFLISFLLFLYCIVVFWISRKSYYFFNFKYWIFLFRPWKIIIFFFGTVLLNLGVYYISYAPTDLYLTLFICTFTFIFAPWTIGFPYRYFKKRFYKKELYLESKYSHLLETVNRQIANNLLFVTIIIYLFVTYWLYKVYGYHFYSFNLPFKFFIISSILFISFGLLFNLEFRNERKDIFTGLPKINTFSGTASSGITFAFLEEDWFSKDVDRSFNKIKWIFYLMTIPSIAVVVIFIFQLAPPKLSNLIKISIEIADEEYQIEFKKIKQIQNIEDSKSIIDVNDFGEYYALLIGVNKYNDIYFDNLDTPVNDVTEIEKILSQKYNFKETIVLTNNDATLPNLNKELKKLSTKLTKNDNLLIYYSGHGYQSEASNQGYWQLSDAKHDEEWTWADIDSDIVPHLRVMKTGHVLIVVDSCFSGKLFKQKSGEQPQIDKEYKTIIKDYKKFNSRLGLTATDATKPIPDAGGGKHSVFSKAFIEILYNNTESYFSSAELGIWMKDKISTIRADLSAEQYQYIKPIHNNINIEEHDIGGEFYFVPKINYEQ